MIRDTVIKKRVADVLVDTLAGAEAQLSEHPSGVLGRSQSAESDRAKRASAFFRQQSTSRNTGWSQQDQPQQLASP
jgi:hypothetical protein